MFGCHLKVKVVLEPEHEDLPQFVFTGATYANFCVSFLQCSCGCPRCVMMIRKDFISRLQFFWRINFRRAWPTVSMRVRETTTCIGCDGACGLSIQASSPLIAIFAEACVSKSHFPARARHVSTQKSVLVLSGSFGGAYEVYTNVLGPCCSGCRARRRKV